jgi:hypothetical protein
MTVSSATSRNEYNGNAATLIFAYTFRILDEDHIAVYVDDVLKTITTHYTVSGVGDSGGGSITFLSAPASGTGNVVFIRNVPVTQETDYVENDPFPAESHEEALDKLTMIVQQINDLSLTSFRIPISEGDAGELPAAASRANKYFAFDANGNAVMTSGTTSSYVVTPFMETVLDDVDASIARSTLGLAIGTNVQAYAASASQVEMETGTEANLRAMSPLRVAQAIAAQVGGTTLTRTTFTATGNLTFPAGVTQAWVTGQACGGGGGGTTAGGNGGTTTFGPNGGAVVLTLAGGTGGSAASGTTGGAGGAGGGTGLNKGRSGRAGQYKQTIGGGVNPAAYCVAVGGRGGSGEVGELGSGGNGGDGGNTSGGVSSAAAGGGGGAGEQCFSFPVTVTAAQWDVIIGSAGTAGTADGGTAPQAGQAGFFIVEYLS